MSGIPAGRALVCLLTLAVSLASQEEMRETPRSAETNYTGYGVANVTARIIRNRLPAKAYPLYLSSLIQAGRIADAQEKSRVRNLSYIDVESYAGYITVNPQYRSNMFFWFFPAENTAPSAPVLLWLNGGPGRTSLVGALLENGPYEITTAGKLIRRKVAWTKHFSMLYVDNPVGVGYSFTKKGNGYSRSMSDVSRNLYSLLVQFFKMFPDYTKSEFYVGGQSYAGKYVPALGQYIHERNADAQQPINFKGIYLGAGLCDPENMLPVLPDFLYNIGLITDAYRNRTRHNFVSLIKRVLHQNGKSSSSYMLPVLPDFLYNIGLITDAYRNRTRHNFVSLIKRVLHQNGKSSSSYGYMNYFFGSLIDHAGVESADNLLGKKATNAHLMSPLNSFMQSAQARLKLHVGYARIARKRRLPPLTSSKRAANYLSNEFLLNTTFENAFLMDQYKVLHYSGNLDIVVNVPMTEAFLQRVPWAGRVLYNTSKRRPWALDGKLAGWVTRIKQFTRVVIRNSGHMVPYDQPQAALDMMKKFIFGQKFPLFVVRSRG